MSHRHCDISKCYEIAGEEVRVSRDSHAKYGRVEFGMWVCKEHIADAVALCGNQISTTLFLGVPPGKKLVLQ